MESVIYILVVTGALATIFFAIAFREPPKIGK
ncbi:MAG: photosystem II reaction center protein T [Synechococcales cyanobacterium RM1_1_8]|jgi:photosystem II PsbT protein|nr:photosystem II reaction center protein T [Synechococcales cyanobacterium RU_4_20]NJN30908.1 photosystem II reaction center protein T [Synechococcales cyanobacterium RM1_1_8]NJR67714.1 photosystem II reaction center protein T [Synechococcales cyanobacterium CRU_2_2]